MPTSPKMRRKEPKFVDFVESAPFPEAISKAPVDFGTAEMEGKSLGNENRLLGGLEQLFRDGLRSPRNA